MNSIEKKVHDLEPRVAALESRIAALEAAAHPIAATQATAPVDPVIEDQEQGPALT